MFDRIQVSFRLNFAFKRPKKEYDLTAVGHSIAHFEETLKFLQQLASTLPESIRHDEEINKTLDRIEELFEDDRNGKKIIDHAINLLRDVVYELKN